jgi:hypothetical protein
VQRGKKKPGQFDRAFKAPPKEETEGAWNCIQASGAKETTFAGEALPSP